MSPVIRCFIVLAIGLMLGGLSEIALGEEQTAAPFERLHCFRYAQAVDVPQTTLLWQTDPSVTLSVPMVICAARRGDDVVVLDAGYTDQAVGKEWGVGDYRDFGPLLAEVGIRPDQVKWVTVSHLHWDHAGGTAEFPNAHFVVQRRELEFAAGRMPHNSVAKAGFRARDVLDLVALNWQSRVRLVDGDVEDVVPGVDVYLTPGHTAGTMTVCLDTVKGRVCYTSDAVYTYRNIEEDIALGFGLDLAQSVDSFAKIRGIVGKGILIPGHEAALFENPEKFGFRRVSRDVIAVVE